MKVSMEGSRWSLVRATVSVALARREQQREGGLSKGKIAVLAVISRKTRKRGGWIERYYFSEG